VNILCIEKIRRGRLVIVSKKDKEEQSEPFDKFIHEPSRLKILAQLYVVESEDFIALKVQTGLTWGNLSSHIAKLEEKGYVNVKKEFKGKKPRSWANLTPKGRASFEEYMESIQGFLSKKVEEAKKIKK
jgi:DNA-binding MarR family transcriptional regulator